MTIWILYVFLAMMAVYVVVVLIYYFIQERILFVAKPIARSYKYLLSTDFTEHFIESKEKGLINVLHVKSKESKGLIIYFHGNTGNLKRWAHVSSEFTSLGYDVLVYDYRGFGKSKGRRNEENMHYDAKLVYEFAQTIFDEAKIILYARSMGTGMAVKLATQTSPKKLFLETPYHSMLAVGQFHTPFIPVRFLLRFTFKSYKWINDVKCPIYIFHGTKDRIIPHKHALQLYGLIKNDPKNKMITIPNGRHSNLNSFPLFRDSMTQFMEE